MLGADVNVPTVTLACSWHVPLEPDGPVRMLLASLESSQQLDTFDEYIRGKHWNSYNSDGL
jgi:hypothetical protein